MAEVEARLAVKPAEFQVEGSRDAKAEKETSLADIPDNAEVELRCEGEMETSLADMPENAMSASSKNEMETRLTDKTDRQD